MPFDPDAYIASKAPAAAGGGFDPDAYIASKAPASAPVAATPAEPEDKRGIVRRYVDAVKAPIDIASTAISGLAAQPIANVAGLAATGYEAITHGGRGDGEMPGQFRDAVARRLTYNGHNPTADAWMAPPRAIGEAVGNAAGRVKDAAMGGAAADSPRGMAVNAGAEGIKQGLNFVGLKGAQAVPKVAAAGAGVKDTLLGTGAKAARGEAMTAARGAVEGVERGHAATQSTKLTEAQTYEDSARRTQATLDAALKRTGTPTADLLGEEMRGGYLKVMEDAKAARKAATDPLYEQARAAATAREAAGERVDVTPALKDVREMLRLSQNLPDLQAKLGRLREAVEGSTPRAEAPVPLGSGKVTSKLVPPRPVAPMKPLTYEELAMANRYIKDIAFSGEAEGYGALIRNTAKKLSIDLDAAISKFVPEHAAAADKYRELSAPMETMSTRIGEALHETEGGLKGEAYAKVSAQDLPARIFGKKDRIEQLVDALAGGKKATPEARATAQATVDTWVENWVLDKSRGAVGADAAKAVAAPGMRAALNAAPGAAQRLERTFGDETSAAARLPELQKGADAARKEAHVAATAREKVRTALSQAQIDLEHGSTQKAYEGYVAALRQGIGGADPAKYRAAIALIERASTLEEKTARARKLAMGVAGLVGVAGAAKIGVQLPGVL